MQKQNGFHGQNTGVHLVATCCRPAFTVCSWALNWGRILFEDVTIVGVSTDLRTTADVTILETGREWVSHCGGANRPPHDSGCHNPGDR
jgi:hypothetical protein